MTEETTMPNPATEATVDPRMPVTEAGRALRDDPALAREAVHPHPDYVTDCWLCRAILAIEQEAAAGSALDVGRLARALAVADWTPAWYATVIPGGAGEHEAGWDSDKLAAILATEYSRSRP